MSARTQAFAEKVQLLVNEGLTYLEAIVIHCEENDIDPSKAKKYMDDILKEKLRVCCAKHRLICDELPPSLVPNDRE